MLVAIFSVHIQKGFWAQNGGYEYNLVLIVAALTLAFTGPGSLSVDMLHKYDEGGAVPGLEAVVAGVLAAAISLAQRKVPPTVSPSASKNH
jgi:putative oxidoreductase